MGPTGRVTRTRRGSGRKCLMRGWCGSCARCSRCDRRRRPGRSPEERARARGAERLALRLRMRLGPWFTAVTIGLLGGCATHWEREYRATGPAAAPLPAGAPVRVREVLFERVQETLRTLTEEAA